MSPIIFITGVSGYIGGHVVHLMVKKHPEWEIFALVRDQQQSDTVKLLLPTVQTVIGDLDSHALLLDQGAKADVVLQTASADHIAGGQSIIEGMGMGKKGKFVHTSGTGMLHDVSNGYGEASDKIWNDVSDVKEITSLDLSHIHRDVDSSVIDAGIKFGIPTAIVSPDTIHGIGSGPIKKRSLQIPFLAEAFLKRGKGFSVGAGKNIWDNVHIGDLASAYILLVEEALKPNGGKATWGPEGYYFTSAADHIWSGVAKAIAEYEFGAGMIQSAEIDVLDTTSASEWHPWAPLLWGGNCRSRSERLRALGWIPTGPTIYESIPAMVEFEIKNLGSQTGATTFDSAKWGGVQGLMDIVTMCGNIDISRPQCFALFITVTDNSSP